MDHRDQCCVEGESQQLTDPHLGPELSDVMKDEANWISKRDSLTVFDSTGYSLFDLIAAEYATETAQRLGVGIDLDLGVTEGDPYDPYVSLNRDAFR
jgi:L-lysine cyclodeaminase